MSLYIVFSFFVFVIFKAHDGVELRAQGLRGYDERFNKFLDISYIAGQFFEIIFLISYWHDTDFLSTLKLLIICTLSAGIATRFFKNLLLNVVCTILIWPFIIYLFFQTKWFGLF